MPRLDTPRPILPWLHAAWCWPSRCRGAAIALLLVFGPVTAVVGEDGYILLRNGNVMRGELERLGHLVVVRRNGEEQLKLQASQVVCTGDSLEELHRHRVSKRSAYDIKGILDDVRWCLRHGMHAEVEQLLQQALMLDPTHPEAARLRRQWQVLHQPANAETVSRVRISQDPEPQQRKASEEAEEAIDRELQSLGMPESALAQFSRQVQPLLINRCGNAGCHRAPRDSGWELAHWGSHVRPPGRMTKQNLLATFRQVDRNDPGQSDLIRYALSPHGGRRAAPVRDADDPVFSALRQWVETIPLWEAHRADQLNLPLTALAPLPVGMPPVPLDELPGYRSAEMMEAEIFAGMGPTAVIPGQVVRQASFLEEPPTPPTLPRPSGSDGPGFSGGPSGSSLRSGAGDLPSPPPASSFQPLSPAKPAEAIRSGPTQTKVTRLPPVENPFDPEIFNRSYRNAGSVGSTWRTSGEGTTPEPARPTSPLPFSPQPTRLGGASED